MRETTEKDQKERQEREVTDKECPLEEAIYIYRSGFVPDLCPDAVYSGALGKHHVYSVGVVHLSRCSTRGLQIGNFFQLSVQLYVSPPPSHHSNCLLYTSDAADES